MRKYFVFLLVLAACIHADASGRPGRTRDRKTGLKASAEVLYYFDNREFAYSGDYPLASMTTHAVVLTPALELYMNTGKSSKHSLVLGCDLSHDMGSGTWKDFFREGLLYYHGQSGSARGRFDAYAGIFPKSAMHSEWSEAVFSDLNRFLDRNMEGLLLRWESDRFMTEAACDWMGLKGYDRKERFQILCAGEWTPLRYFSAGWNVSYYHYAGSELAPGVADNGLGSVFVKLGGATGKKALREIYLKASLMQGYHRDRTVSNSLTTPTGGEIETALKLYAVKLSQTVYFGGDQLPFYEGHDTAGNPYGSNLYFGQPLYRGFYDRVELAWEPKITKILRLKLSARAHFNSTGFLGWQQVVSLKVCF